MYPNPQDVLPLPPRPDLDQYRKRAKNLAFACRSGDDAILAWATQWIAALVKHQPATIHIDQRDIERRTHQVADFARERLRHADCGLSQAQFVIARAHGFESWPRLVHHLEGLTHLESDISAFERAADAIAAGDLPTLEHLLRADPELVRTRSSREHHATLLHYVSANGVEHYRQRTPANIESIARYLLDAGAVVDAEADVYGGGATTLGLVVTSAHPRLAGVQNSLADLLLSRGARLDPEIVHYCLMNGCPEAGAHLAGLGAPVDLIDAAGIGHLDLVRAAFHPPRTVSPKDAAEAIVMAAWYGQAEVVALLLDHGVDPGIRSADHARTALHVAAYSGAVEVVELLLSRGAPVDARDALYQTPPMVWALHAWLIDNRSDARSYSRILLALVAAGAQVKREWLDDDRIRADPELYAALLHAADRA
ncbi:MAG: ankyrin repeat domain-containing protein [Gemmatimonadota bacterium]